jgi:hypothetical protein
MRVGGVMMDGTTLTSMETKTDVDAGWEEGSDRSIQLSDDQDPLMGEYEFYNKGTGNGEEKRRDEPRISPVIPHPAGVQHYLYLRHRRRRSSQDQDSELSRPPRRKEKLDL